MLWQTGPQLVQSAHQCGPVCEVCVACYCVASSLVVLANESLLHAHLVACETAGCKDTWQPHLCRALQGAAAAPLQRPGVVMQSTPAQISEFHRPAIIQSMADAAAPMDPNVIAANPFAGG